MVTWNVKELFTSRTEFAIKSGEIYYETDQLIQLEIDLEMLLDVWRTTDGTVKAAPYGKTLHFHLRLKNQLTCILQQDKKLSGIFEIIFLQSLQF